MAATGALGTGESRSQTATLAPSAAKRRAVAPPMPPPAPVTSTTWLSDRFIGVSGFLWLAPCAARPRNVNIYDAIIGTLIELPTGSQKPPAPHESPALDASATEDARLAATAKPPVLPRLYQCCQRRCAPKTGARAVEAEGLTTQQWAVLRRGVGRPAAPRAGWAHQQNWRYTSWVSRQNLSGRWWPARERAGHLRCRSRCGRPPRRRLVRLTPAGRAL